MDIQVCIRHVGQTMSESEEINFEGMTVNERLFAAKLLESFDAVAGARDRDGMIAIIRSVDVDPPEPTVDAILERPEFYGY